MAATVLDTVNRIQYTASTGQTNFPYPFRIFESDDLDVYQQLAGDDTVTLLSLDIDYTVTGVDDTGGGDVVLTFGAALDTIITIVSDIPYTQFVDFGVGGKFEASTVNFVNDKMTRLIQQVNMLISDLGLTYSSTDQVDQSVDRKDNRLPLLPSNSGSGIPIWTKNSDGALVAALLVEDPDCSTLRSELADDQPVSNGAGIVGYYNVDTAASETVKDALDFLVSNVAANQFTTGDVKMTWKTVADSGWVLWNDGTIGSAASTATTRANADTEYLFTLLWNNVSDTWAPVSGGRGGSAAADFAANKTLMLPRGVGRAMGIYGLAVLNQTFTADNTTEQLTVANADVYYTGTPVQLTSAGTLPAGLSTSTTYYVIYINATTIKLAANSTDASNGDEIDFTDDGSGTHTIEVQYTNRDLGEALGEEDHVSVVGELAQHDHPPLPAYSHISQGTPGIGGIAADGGTNSWVGKNQTASGNTGVRGDADPANNMQPSIFLSAMIKL